MPQVFISYSHFDEVQRQRVRVFAERLRNRDVEVLLDQFYIDQHPGGPSEGWPKWYSDQAANAAKVIIIGDSAWFGCYAGKENCGNALCAVYEASVIQQRIIQTECVQNVVRVAFFEQSDLNHIPLDLTGYGRCDLTHGIDQLCAWVKDSQNNDEGHQETKLPDIRFCSTRESVARGEVSVLAIMETLLAVGILFFVPLWTGTPHLVAGACLIAPLSLLRTQDSIQLGLKWYNRHFFSWWMTAVDVLAVMTALYLNYQVRKSIPGLGPLAIALGWGPLVLAVYWPKYFLIRTGSVLHSLVMSPIVALRSIPVNWRKVVMSEDSLVHTEFLPGKGEGPLELFRRNVFSERARRKNSRLPFLAKWAKIGVYTIGFVCLTIVTSAYRWSLKATCLIYLPLVWLANKAQYTPHSSVRNMLHDYLMDDIQRVRRWLAYLAFAALTVKVFIWWHLDTARVWAHTHVPEWALKLAHEWNHYFDLENLPWWQITPALNGIIALGMMVYARRVLNLKDYTPTDTVVLRNWRVLSVVSGTLSVYTIICLLLLTWKTGDWMGALQKLSKILEHKVLP